MVPPPLFPDAAADALAVFKSLRMTDVAGTPTFGEACAQWVFDFVTAIFGACDPETGVRHINQFLLLISKKNGKSTIAAGIMLTALIINWRNDAGLSILAPTIEVAHNSFDPAAAMVRADPDLVQLIHVQDHLRILRHRTTNAVLRVIAADSDTAAGAKDGFVLVDELWLFGKRPRAKAMLDEATGGLASRPEGFVIYLTTHSDEQPIGVFNEKLQYARRVRDGLLDDRSFLPLLYEWPKAMLDAGDYLQPEMFHVTNPNLGRSVSMDFLTAKLIEARESNTKGSLQLFLAKHLNVEIGLRLSHNRWVGADYWEAACEPGLTLDALLERCDVVSIGIDGGGLDDLLGLAVLGRERDTRRWLHWGHAWAHPIVLDRRKGEASRLEDLAKTGDLTITTGPTDDIMAVADLVERIWALGLLPEKAGIALDPFCVTALLDEIVGRGVPDETQIGFRQGGALSPAVWGLERKLADGTFLHCGQTLMAWCIGNAVAEQRGNAVIITKETAGRAKIDPLVALFNAAMVMGRNPEAAGGGPSVYLGRGLLVV